MPHILVIDDDDLFRDCVVEMLFRAGHRVKTLDNGSYVEPMLVQYRFDLVITDLYMPSKDGIESMSAVKRCSPEVPVIVMSGERDDPCVRMMTLLGAAAILEKPFDAAALSRAVQAVLAGGAPTDFCR
jgi:DNA-binding NtrC family response regulator